jgi:hypothetical protein
MDVMKTYITKKAVYDIRDERPQQPLSSSCRWSGGMEVRRKFRPNNFCPKLLATDNHMSVVWPPLLIFLIV